MGHSFTFQLSNMKKQKGITPAPKLFLIRRFLTKTSVVLLKNAYMYLSLCFLYFVEVKTYEINVRFFLNN